MKVKVCIGLVLAIMATACLCRPAAEAPGAAGDPRQLPTSLVRRDWPDSLSQEQKHFISQFLPVFTGTRRCRVGSHGGGWSSIRHSPAPPSHASPQPGAALTCCPCRGRAERPQGLRARGRGDGGPARPLLPRLDGLRPSQRRGAGRCRVAAGLAVLCRAPARSVHVSSCNKTLALQPLLFTSLLGRAGAGGVGGRAGGLCPQPHQEWQGRHPTAQWQTQPMAADTAHVSCFVTSHLFDKEQGTA